MAYKHGVYGNQKAYSGLIAATALGTIPVYVGTAPIQQVNTSGTSGYDYSGMINTPILIDSLSTAKSKIGYSDSWDKYTLGEAIKAHFDNGVSAIGPIVVVNMASPAVLEASATVSTINLTGSTGNKIGYIKDALAAIENVVVTSTTSLVRSDYTLEYDGDSIKITITKSGYADASCTATYNRVNVADTVLTTTAFENAINSIDLAESKLGVIPNIIAAPYYSEKPTYHAKMIAKAASKISQKWYAICVSDVISDATADTVAEAIALKATNGYISKLDKVCWPMAKLGSYIYHLSTIAVVTMQQEDTNADGVPYISPSNKAINASSMVVKSGTQISFDEVTANSLNQAGITTMNIVRGSLRLWGPHMANYSYASVDSINPEDRTDSSIRMMQYLLNTLQYDFLDSVDKPFGRRDIDSILASVQQWLNGLVNEGKLLYATVNFTESSNSTADLINGDFTFDVATTTTPNAKSLTFTVQYTTTGLSSLIGGTAE